MDRRQKLKAQIFEQNIAKSGEVPTSLRVSYHAKDLIEIRMPLFQNMTLNTCLVEILEARGEDARRSHRPRTFLVLGGRFCPLPGAQLLNERRHC